MPGVLFRQQRHVMAIVVVIFAASCGGGAGPAVNQVHIAIRLSELGTVIDCVSDSNAAVSLARDGAVVPALTQLACPFSKLLVNDHRLSNWSAPGTGTALVTIDSDGKTSLPAPLVVPLDLHTWIVVERWVDLVSNAGLRLRATATDGSTTDLAPVGRLMMIAPPPNGAWRDFRWVSADASGNGAYTSPAVAAAPATLTSLDFAGGLAVGDLSGRGADELVGTHLATGLSVYQVYEALGLAPLFEARDFRDMRVADLNGDGRDDVVSNVYGVGCTLIGLNKGDGSFEFKQPLREDGSCIGGHGETLVVADFDNDGRLDIFVNSYERWDLLLNLGGGAFRDVAVDRGIDFPNYAPPAEGAAAVDIDLDGHVDIVVGSEILLNDGSAHFTRLPNVYGPLPLHDEGIYVADVDGDGLFDIVKHDPSSGAQVFWGQPGRTTFESSPPLLGDVPMLSGSYGLAVADLAGNGLMDVVVAGGYPEGTAPHLCLQTRPRQFDCLQDGWASDRYGFQDLLLASDFDGDGRNELAARVVVTADGGAYQSVALAPSFARLPAAVFSFDLRNALGRRAAQGRSARIGCAADGSLLALRTVDGGNGFMSQGRYDISAGSEVCRSVVIDVFTPKGVQRFGPYSPGRHTIHLAS